jgi:spermidine synthase
LGPYQLAVLFVLSIFLSAALMFAVQPMVGRLVLPSLGGSPAVWNTVMVFFQASLLVGYAMAHLIARLRSARTQAFLHAVLVVAALATLPIGFRVSGFAQEQSPTLGLIASLLLGVGMPALALATMSPILQHWYSSLGLKRSHDPYFLYAASNAGSLIGLLGYPLVIEPTVGLSHQTIGWSIGFAALAVQLLVVWIKLARLRSHSTTAEAVKAEPVPRGDWLRWIVLAMVPSSLLLGVTQHITTDIAAMPLLWAVPLALYLVTFIIAFSGRAGNTARVMSRVVPILAVAVTAAVLIEAKHPLVAVLLLHLSAFFAIALGCHARLAESRPSTAHLTQFYLFVSIGGVLGGMTNALVAPSLLNWVAEYPIMIAVGAGLAVGWPNVSKKLISELLPAIIFALIFAAALFFTDKSGQTGTIVLIGLPAVACFLLSTKPARFALALLATMLLPAIIQPDSDMVYRERTFFGVHTVYLEDSRVGPRHVLRHGGTIHGLQNIGIDTPATYYHPTGPIGEVLAKLSPGADIGAIGLGVGSVAGLAREGDTLTFYEIDPEVLRIASDPAMFTYIQNSAAEVSCIIGDGRLTIADSDPLDLVIIDAFTSDAIPAHLMTAEAMGLYAGQLKPGGVIAMHLSNRYLELEPVVAATADNAGLVGKIRTDVPNSREISEGKFASVWVVLAADDTTLNRFDDWAELEAPGDTRPWTDDYANILGVLRLD